MVTCRGIIQQYSYFSLPLLVILINGKNGNVIEIIVTLELISIHIQYEYIDIILITAQQSQAWKTGLESGLICYQCVGTHPGCTLYNMDTRWYWGKICPRKDDRCVKV